MKSQTEIAALLRARSPLPLPETERLIRGTFRPPRAVRFACEQYGADQLAVLEVGCAMGQHLLHFGPGSVGLDAIAANVEFARALGLAAVTVNVEDGLPSFATPFDAVFCSNVLEHLVAPHLFLLRLHRVLRPGGLVFVHVPTIPPAPMLDRLVRRLLGHNGYLASEHLYAWTPRTLAFLLERAGVDVVETAFPALRGHPVLRVAERLAVHAGITTCAVARRNAAFAYPAKRVAVFTPRFAAS
jgi:SAM-dependent methyltransferase